MLSSFPEIIKALKMYISAYAYLYTNKHTHIDDEALKYKQLCPWEILTCIF